MRKSFFTLMVISRYVLTLVFTCSGGLVFSQTNWLFTNAIQSGAETQIRFPAGTKSARVVLFTLEGLHIAELSGKSVMVNGSPVMTVRMPLISAGAYLLFIDTDQIEFKSKIRILSP